MARGSPKLSLMQGEDALAAATGTDMCLGQQEGQKAMKMCASIRVARQWYISRSLSRDLTTRTGPLDLLELQVARQYLLGVHVGVVGLENEEAISPTLVLINGSSQPEDQVIPLG